jgi:hypothetical protein
MGRSYALRTVAAACGFVALMATPARADPFDACIDSAEQGQRLRLEGKLTRAREKLLACSQAQCPVVVRSDCSRWLSEIERLTPSIVLRAVDSAGADVVDVRVEVDDRTLTERLDGSEIHVDPGQHVFRFTRAGAAPMEQTVLVREGEQHRPVSVIFATPVPVPPKEGSGLAPVRSGTEADMRPLPAAPPRSRVNVVWPIAAIGAGGLAIAGASYLWISGLSEHGTLVSGCGATHSCSSSDVDSAHQKLVVGDVTAGAGIALVALGIGILILDRAPDERAKAVAIQPVPSGALLVVDGSL